jgi:hypothetical protein
MFWLRIFPINASPLGNIVGVEGLESGLFASVAACMFMLMYNKRALIVSSVWLK